MNKVILMGRLTRDPELRYSQSGQAVCRYALAVNRSYKRDGEPDADFFNITAFAKRGEFAGKYFRKGQMVAVCGELRNNSYEKNGVKQYSTDIIVTDQYFTGGRSEQAPSVNAPVPQQGIGTYQTGNYAAQVPQTAYRPSQEQMQLDSGGFIPVDPGDLDGDIPF